MGARRLDFPRLVPDMAPLFQAPISLVRVCIHLVAQHPLPAVRNDRSIRPRVLSVDSGVAICVNTQVEGLVAPTGCALAVQGQVASPRPIVRVDEDSRGAVVKMQHEHGRFQVSHTLISGNRVIHHHASWPVPCVESRLEKRSQR